MFESIAVIVALKNQSLRKTIVFLVIVSPIWVQAMAMQEAEYREEQANVRVSYPLSPFEHRIIPLRASSSNPIPLTFERPEVNSVTHYELEGKHVAQLVAANNEMHFVSPDPQSYNFLVTRPFEVGLFTVDAQGRLTFQDSVKVQAASLKCKSVEFMGSGDRKFLSSGPLVLEANCCNNNGEIACSDFLFKGNQFNTLRGSTLKINGEGAFSSLKGIFNGGEISCAASAAIKASVVKNLGILSAESLHFSGQEMTNTGSIDIQDSFVGECEKLDNQNTLNVRKDLILKHVDQLNTRQSSQLRVGEDWKGNVNKLTLDGQSFIGNKALLSVGSFATLNGPFHAPIIHLDSQGIITCHPHAKFFVTHYLGLKAKGWLQYDGDVLEKSLNARAQNSQEEENSLLDVFPRGVFLHSTMNGIKKSGRIISRDGTVALNAKGNLKHIGLTEAGFRPDSVLVMNADSVILEKESHLEAISARLMAKDLLHKQGDAHIAQQLVMESRQIIHEGVSESGDLLALKGQEILTQKSSDIKGKTVVCEAEEKIEHQGNLKAQDTLSMHAKNITLETSSQVTAQNSQIKADEDIEQKGCLKSENLSMNAKNLKNSGSITAENAQLKATETLAQEGTVDVSKNLLMRAKFLENSGSITAQNAHLKADRWWWNTGSVDVQENLNIDAGISVNMFNKKNVRNLKFLKMLGRIEAKTLKINAGLDINLLGVYRAQNANINALVGLNAGLFVPKVTSWGDLFNKDNLKRTGETLFNMWAPAPFRMVYGAGKAVFNIKGTYKQLKELYKEGRTLYSQEDAGVSDWIPLICGLKDATIASVSLAKTSVSMVKTTANGYKEWKSPASSSGVENKTETEVSNQEAVSNPKEASSSEETSNAQEVANTEKPQQKTVFNNPTMNDLWEHGKTAASLVGACGPHLGRDTLLDVGVGATLGVNGHSRSLCNINKGASFFANSYTLDTYYGSNSGVIGAMNLNIHAVKKYSSSAEAHLYGVTGSISGDDLEIQGKIRMIDRLSLESRKARIGANIRARNIHVKGKEEVVLQKGGSIHADGGNATIEADKITSAADIAGQNVSVKGQDVVLEKGGSVRAQEVASVEGQRVTSGADISGKNVGVKGQDVVLEKGGSVRAQEVASVVGERVTSGADISGKNVGVQGKDVVLQNGSNLQAQEVASVNAERLKSESGSTISGKIAFVDAASYQGEVGSKIKSTEGTCLKTKALDNQGTIEGSVGVLFSGTADQFKSIGQVDSQGGTFFYQGAIRQDNECNNLPTADELADGRGQWGHVTNQSTQAFDVGQDVNFKKKHDCAYTVGVKTTGAVRFDEKMTSDKSIYVDSQETITINASLKANENIGLGAKKGVTGKSKAERVGTETNYEDQSTEISISAGQGLGIQSGANVEFKGVKTSSGAEGTHISAKGDIIDEALTLEKRQEKHGRHKITKDTSTKAQVSKHTSKGVFIAQAEGECKLEAPDISAKQIGIHGVKGTTISDVHDTHMQESAYKKNGGFFGNSKDAGKGEKISTSRGAKLHGELPTQISSAQGKVTLTNVKATSDTGDKALIITEAKEGVEFLLGENARASYEESKQSNIFWHSEKKHAERHKTYSESTFSGHVDVYAQKVAVQSVRGQALELLDKLRQQEGGEILQGMLEEEHWSESSSSQGPTKALTTVIVLAVTMSTGGAASSFGAGLATAFGLKSGLAFNVLSNMGAAAFTSVCVQASRAIVENEGNPVKAARAFAQSKTLKAMLLSVGTAGLMAGANEALNMMGVPHISEARTFGERCMASAAREGARAGINTGIDIASGQDPRESVVRNVRSFAARTLGAVGASEIGEAYGNQNIGFVTHKLLHGAVGALSGGIEGGRSGAVAGALGATVAETVADVFAPSAPTFQSLRDLEAEKGRKLTEDEFNSLLREYIDKSDAVGEGAKLTAAIAALFAGQDVDIASMTASTAVDNNFLILASFVVTTAWAAYNVCHAIQEGGIEAGLKQLGIEVITYAAGYGAGVMVVKMGGVVYPSVRAAMNVALSKTPGLRLALGKTVEMFCKFGEQVGRTRVGARVAQIEASILRTEAHALNSIQRAGQAARDKIPVTFKPRPNRLHSNGFDAVDVTRKVPKGKMPSAAPENLNAAYKPAVVEPSVPSSGEPLHFPTGLTVDEIAAEAEREAIRQSIFASNRKITIDEMEKLGFRGKSTKYKNFNKNTGNITLNTELPGGMAKAEEMLDFMKNEFSGRKLIAEEIELLPNSQRITYKFEDGSLVQLRTEGKSSHPKVEINDMARNIYEKITFKEPL